MRLLPTSLGRSFNGLWFATGSANLGDGMALFVLPLLAIAVHASPGGVAAVTTALTLAWPIVGLHAGWIVDRVNRRALLTTVNLIRAVVLAGVTASYLTDTLSLPVILLAAVLLGVAETLVDTALTSIVPMVVEPAGRGRANARIEATINLTNQLIGPPLAGLLAGVTLALATGTSAALYVLAIAGIITMTLRRTPHTAAQAPDAADTAATAGASSGYHGVGAGFRFLWRQPLLRTLTLVAAAMNFVGVVAVSLMVLYAVSPGPLDLTAAQYGLILTAMAIGGLLASMVVEPLRRRFGTARLMIADTIGIVLLVAPVALGAGVWAVAAGAVVSGAGISIWRILAATIRQNLSPPHLMGRVYSAYRVISWGVFPVSSTLAGIGAELWGVRAVFAIASVLGVLTVLVFVPFALRTDLSAAATEGVSAQPT